MTYYRLVCEVCGYCSVTDGTNPNLIEYKRAKIQKEIPKLDDKTGKTVKATWINLPKKFKCPKCGRLISPRKYKEPEVNDKTKNVNEQSLDSGSQGGFERS